MMTLRVLAVLSVLAAAGCVAPPPPPMAVLPPPGPPAPAPTGTASSAPEQPTCREFHQTITIGGEAKEAFGTSCLQPDGTWRVVSAPDMTAAPDAGAPPAAPPPVAAVPAYLYPYAYPYPYPYPAWAYGPPFYGSVFFRGRWR